MTDTPTLERDAAPGVTGAGKQSNIEHSYSVTTTDDHHTPEDQGGPT